MARSEPPDAASDPFDVAGLAELGLVPGERVRFVAGGRRGAGTVHHRERDGSVGLHDADGAARAIPPERISVEQRGPRGGTRWVPLAERSSGAEQRRLL